MQFSLSANFQDDFVDSIKDYPVKEVYGKLPEDFIGGGRPSFMVPWISRKGLRALVQELHKHGISFNYLINSTCLDNRESTNSGYREIRKLLDWICSTGADSVTVAMPFLGELIARHYPELEIKVSAFACVHNIRQVEYWEDLGADMITLEPQSMNRELARIEKICSKKKAKIQLIVNQGCLHSCPNVRFHSNAFSHASQKNHTSGGFMIDYSAFKCRYLKLNDPVNFIRADWIRPEDIKEYEAIGVKHYKIIQRNWPTDKLVRILNAYTNRVYDGNLADLSEFLFGENAHLDILRKFRYFFRPFSISADKLMRIYKNTLGLSDIVDINNTKLDGFIDKFKDQSCAETDCDDCRHCHEYALRAVKIKDTKALERLRENIDLLIRKKDSF